MNLNRRSFIQRCFAVVGGAVAVFVPGKENLPKGFKSIEEYKKDEPYLDIDEAQKGIKNLHKYKWRRWRELGKKPQTFTKKDIDNIWVSAERNPICPICDREMYLSLISKFPNNHFYKCEKSPHYWTYNKELFLSDLKINGEKVLLLT